nr:hypothetical protein [Streptomyces sp. HNM0574]
MSELVAWAARRERFSADRAAAVAAAWRTGTRNVAELARLARVSRDTVYADLAARGVDRDAPAEETPAAPAAGEPPLRADTVRHLAGVADSVVRPAYARAPDDPLVGVALAATRALGTVADVLEPPSGQGPGWTPRETLPGLAEEGEKLARHSRRALTSQAGPDELAADTDSYRQAVLHGGRHAVAEGASLALTLPTGESVTVRLERDEAGRTLLTSDSPLVAGDTDALDHLEAEAALQALARVATRHLTDAARVGRRKDAAPGNRLRTRTIPGNED